jgi:alginate O-acetyltransferase complex protein AlgI
MAFNSYSYFVFVAIAVILFWQLPPRWRGRYLLVVSLVYYATWQPSFVLIPLSMCIAVYVLAKVMVSKPSLSRICMWTGIGLVTSILAFFKYRYFVIANWTALFGPPKLDPRSLVFTLALPLGISFYTFECISYLIDVRQKRITKPDLLKLCNFVTFWPHLMAGPIVRVRELVPQFAFLQRFSYEFLFGGLDRIIWGLIQKNLVANPIGQFVDQGFHAVGVRTTADNWALAIGFGLQIYFDFAGYSNMAIGAAQLLGITLPENFRFPYHAANPSDFWSRWHMTLSRWIRDYLFFPITAKYRGAPIPLYISLLGVMAVVGLWHGAGWGFVLWGIMHGIYLVLYRVFETLQDGRYAALVKHKAFSIGWRAFTIFGVTIAWVPFRTSSLSQSLDMWRSMLMSFTGGSILPVGFYHLIAAVVLFCIVEPYIFQMLAWINDKQQENHAAARALVAARLVAYYAGFILFSIFDQQDTQFIYFQF